MNPPRPRPLVLEIARKAHASRAAVYAALNGGSRPSTIGVSPEKRERILAVARELGYTCNDLARSLATGKTHTLGVLVHSLKNNFYADLFIHLDDLCCQDGYSVFIANSEFDSAREARYLRAFHAKKVDALVIARDPAHRNNDLLEQLATAGIPVITLGEISTAHLPYPNVVFDEAQGDRLAAEHLWALGHRRVLHFNAGKVGDSSQAIQLLRRREFAKAWKTLGGRTLQRFETADPLSGGNELAEFLIGRPRAAWPTAIVCSSDRLAIRAISALRSHRIMVPDDLSVIGFDDIDAAAEFVVPLTTIRLPTRTMAEGVWTLLSERLRAPRSPHGKTASPPRQIVIAPELVVRQSTRPLGSEKRKPSTP